MSEPGTEEVSYEPAALRAALKAAASALKQDGVAFALGGSYALWVHGAPEPRHDVDLVVAETDVQPAVDSLVAAGLDVQRPPEDWLFKAYHEATLVDVLHRLQGVVVDRELLETAVEHEVLGIRLPVLPATAIMTAKLQSLSEHYYDVPALLPIVRAIREQLDWDRIRTETADNPFAEAFLLLVQRLGIAPAP